MALADPTEGIRREMVATLNKDAPERVVLEEQHGQVWDTAQLGEDFIVESFLAPFVGVTRKSDNQHGTLTFQHSPRYYWGFVAS